MSDDKANNPAKAMIMVIDDELNMCRILEKSLQLEGYAVAAFTDPHQALEAFAATQPDLVLTDLLMPDISGVEVVEAVRRLDPTIPAIVVTAHGSIHGAVGAMKAGAYDYVTKPFLIDDLVMTVARALEKRRMDEERISVDALLSRSLGGEEEPVGESAAWRSVMRMVDKVADSSSAVLIQGETGTGKELVARAIHRLSKRSSGRFVAVNCASIPEPLLESELFGHEKGSFTNAIARKLGLMELADRGTLFLDEIGDMSLALQAKLLRVLQDNRIQRVGGTHEIQVNIRILAATHRNLEQEIELGRFRQDLFYRLNVITIQIPPLRERLDDVPILARRFIEEICAQSGRKPPALESEAVALLQSYRWPGNVRELRNIIERTLTLSEGDRIGPEELRADLAPASMAKAGSSSSTPSTSSAPSTAAESSSEMTYQQARDKFERDYIIGLLHRVGGNVSAAARLGEMSRRNLYEKIEKLGIDVSMLKDEA
ncbi:MAG: sigma-54 dependent transcriptional regulator [Candidatus Sumerlaeota bacterium]|nr:sigma-54 dependent transcriptional regulator [Candidatus Sumerlaeota bacterium]